MIGWIINYNITYHKIGKIDVYEYNNNIITKILVALSLHGNEFKIGDPIPFKNSKNLKELIRRIFTYELDNEIN